MTELGVGSYTPPKKAYINEIKLSAPLAALSQWADLGLAFWENNLKDTWTYKYSNMSQNDIIYHARFPPANASQAP